MSMVLLRMSGNWGCSVHQGHKMTIVFLLTGTLPHKCPEVATLRESRTSNDNAALKQCVLQLHKHYVPGKQDLASRGQSCVAPLFEHHSQRCWDQRTGNFVSEQKQNKKTKQITLHRCKTQERQFSPM